MEYGTVIGDNCNYDSYRYVGWEQSIVDNDCYKELFNPKTIQMISKKVSDLTEGVDQYGRRIKVPDSTICGVLSSCYNNNRPQVGDIYSRYIQSGIEDVRNDVRDIIDRCTEIIVSDIKNTFDTIKCNNSLSIWNTLYGDGVNKVGLRQTPKIYTRERYPQRMFFFENY